MPFAIGYQDYAKNAVLAGGSYVETLPLENAQSDDPQEMARSSDALNASTVITVDLGTTRSIGLIVLGPTNVTPGSTYRIRAYDDSAMSTVAFDSGVRTVSGTVIDWSDANDWLEWEDENFWTGIAPSDVDELPLYLIEIVPAASASSALKQWWKIEFFDAANKDGYVEFGRLFMGRIYRPSMNYADSNNEFSINHITDSLESLGGKRSYWDRGVRRMLRVAWPSLPESEVFSDFFRVALKSGTSRQVFVIPEDTETGEDLRKRAFLATLTKAPPIAQVAFQRASQVLDAEEVI